MHVYAEMHCLSNFTFSCGASHAEELAARDYLVEEIKRWGEVIADTGIKPQ